jgi:hypothetical protein
MPGPRGFVWAVYETDDGRLFALRVDAFAVSAGDRGWSTASVGTTNPLPRGWSPRIVVGIDVNGHIRHTRAGRVDAPVWTGASTFWQYEASDGSVQVATVIGRRQEQLGQTPTPQV